MRDIFFSLINEYVFVVDNNFMRRPSDDNLYLNVIRAQLNVNTYMLLLLKKILCVFVEFKFTLNKIAILRRRKIECVSIKKFSFYNVLIKKKMYNVYLNANNNKI